MIRSTFVTSAVLVLVGAQVGAAQQSSEADFKAFQSAMEGRWVGDVTWVADWPGLGEKGDKVTGYTELTVGVGGNVLHGRFFAGNGTSQWIFVYDASAKQIRELGSDSGGTMWTCVISKDGGQWRSQCTGSLADGSPTTGDYRLTITDGGDTHRWTGRTMVGGEAVDDLQDVWRRVGR